MNSESVDLIYLDPPFNSKKNYAAPIGSEAAGAEFKDTWTLSDIDTEWVVLLEEDHPRLMNYLRYAPQRDSDKSYLIYMAMRLLQMHRILQPTGSIYFHCDPTMSHYIKGVMDCIFGIENFRNEIVWAYNKWTNAAKYYQKNHDIIFFYTKSSDYYFNKPMILTNHKKTILERGFDTNVANGTRQLLVYDWERAANKVKTAEMDGRVVVDMTKKPQGVALSDNWTDISYLSSASSERTGYPTQKPLALLERIIQASSREGWLVLDPFAGCATTCVAAAKLRRRWIGIDISPTASTLVAQRIQSELDAIDESEYGRHIHRTDLPQRTDTGKISAPRTHKEYLYGSQGGYCNGCRGHFEKQHLEVDHRIAKSVGGTDHIDNLQLLCSSCNRIKGQRGMEYLMSKLNFDDLLSIQSRI